MGTYGAKRYLTCLLQVGNTTTHYRLQRNGAGLVQQNIKHFWQGSRGTDLHADSELVTAVVAEARGEGTEVVGSGVVIARCECIETSSTKVPCRFQFVCKRRYGSLI